MRSTNAASSPKILLCVHLWFLCFKNWESCKDKSLWLQGRNFHFFFIWNILISWKTRAFPCTGAFTIFGPQKKWSRVDESIFLHGRISHVWIKQITGKWEVYLTCSIRRAITTSSPKIVFCVVSSFLDSKMWWREYERFFIDMNNKYAGRSLRWVIFGFKNQMT